MGRKLIGQPVMCAVRFCHDQQAARILVDPMHDTRAFLAAHAREIAAEMMQQRVDQRSARGARGRMHHHARRFVHHDQIVIFIADIERDVLGPGLDLGRLG